MTEGNEARPGFYHKPIRGLSISLLVLGALCICLSTGALVISLTAMCTYHDENYNWHYENGEYVKPTPRVYVDHCRYYFVYLSPGIWSGLMVISSGIIGIIAAHRKSSCFIVSVMVTSLVGTLMTGASVGLYMVANFEYHYEQITPYPVSLYVINSCGALLSLASAILLLIKFAFSCRAVCCNGKIGLPSITDRYNYQSLYQPHMAFQGNVMQPNMMMQSSAEPIFLMQGQKIIGVMPQQMQQPCATTSIVAQPVNAGYTGAAPQQA